MRAALVLIFLAGCNPETMPPPSGTSVGNPGKNFSRIASITGLTIESAVAEGLSLDLVGCDGFGAQIEVDGSIDLLADDLDQVVPAGEWCALIVEIADQLTVEATGPELAAVEIGLRLDTPITLWAADPIVVDEQSFVLELGGPGWFDAEGLDLNPEVTLVINQDSELHDVLQLGLMQQTAWYLDDDDDGVLALPERNAGPVASAALSPPPAMQDAAPEDTGDAELGSVAVDGCNCAHPGAPLGWTWPLLALGLAARGSRRTAGRSRPGRR